MIVGQACKTSQFISEVRELIQEVTASQSEMLQEPEAVASSNNHATVSVEYRWA
jgi:hypothetical protein